MAYEKKPHNDPLLRDEQNKARQELWNWSNSLEDNGGSALMLASMTGTARQTLMGYLMPQDDQPKTLTEDNITAIVKGFKKPEKNKKKEQLKNDLDGNTQVFITTFLCMVYKAFDRETKLLLVVTQSSEGMTELKITRNDVERPILLYNFCHSRF